MRWRRGTRLIDGLVDRESPQMADRSRVTPLWDSLGSSRYNKVMPGDWMLCGYHSAQIGKTMFKMSRGKGVLRVVGAYQRR